MPEQQKIEQHQAPQQQQAQQLAQQMQGKNPPQPPDHSVLIALSIAALAKQLGDLADLEKDGAKRDAMRAKSAEIIDGLFGIGVIGGWGVRARDVARLWPSRLGAEHPDTGTSLNNLAGLVRAQGAMRVRSRFSVPTLLRCQCTNSPSTKIIRENLAGLGGGDANTK